MRTFFVGVGKVALAIVLAATVLSLLGWAVYTYYQHRENEENASLAIPKNWPPIVLPNLENAKFSLRTIWRNSKVSYQFEMDGYPKSVATVRDQQNRRNSAFTLLFYDQNGFKLFDKNVNLVEMARTVDAKSQPIGLQIDGDFFAASDDYRHVASWQLMWNF